MDEKTDPRDVIASVISQWETAFVELAIFGTSDPDQIFKQVNDFCITRLGSTIAAILFYESSQGAVFGLELADGRHVVVKAHQPTRSPDFLRAVYGVQRHLADHGYPCPAPLLEPAPIGRGYALGEELVDMGEYADAHNPLIRREMAEMLYKLVELARAFTGHSGWQAGPGILKTISTSKLWPTPHSQIFDFEATAAGSEWIDDYASKAKQILLHGVGAEVIGHTEWSVKHFRFIDGKTNVIYDWDSLALDREPVIVGNAARCFTTTRHFDMRQVPTPDEARAFVAEYEAARGSSFTRAERQTLSAAATYAIAYSARCEHCLDLEATTFPEGSFREALARYGEEFLSFNGGYREE